MGRSPIRYFKDQCEIEFLSETVNPDTGQPEKGFNLLRLADCMLIKQSSRKVDPVHPLQAGQFRLMLEPWDEQTTGKPIDNRQFRIGKIILNSGTVEPGPFEIMEVLDRRGRNRKTRFQTLMIDRMNKD